jgi:hypothetical protein
VFIYFILLFLSKNVHIFLFSSNQILNNKKSRKPKKTEKEFPKKGDNKTREEQKAHRKLPEPIIYQGENRRNILLAEDDDEFFKQHREQTMREARAITNYFLELHKDMVNSYSLEYTNLIKNIFNSSRDDFTIPERVTDYPFDIQNMYSVLSSNRDNSLKLIDNIITKNMYAFIKSIEVTQRFYKDVIESYLNCIKKVN